MGIVKRNNTWDYRDLLQGCGTRRVWPVPRLDEVLCPEPRHPPYFPRGTRPLFLFPTPWVCVWTGADRVCFYLAPNRFSKTNTAVALDVGLGRVPEEGSGVSQHSRGPGVLAAPRGSVSPKRIPLLTLALL